jgi:hypothetical protein
VLPWFYSIDAVTPDGTAQEDASLTTSNDNVFSQVMLPFVVQRVIVTV